MLTPHSFSNLHQGQLFGAKPTLEEFERQLEVDPMTRAINQFGAMLGQSLTVVRRVKLFAMQSALDARRQSDRPRHLPLEQ
jgi:hypothetical protein